MRALGSCRACHAVVGMLVALSACARLWRALRLMSVPVYDELWTAVLDGPRRCARALCRI